MPWRRICRTLAREYGFTPQQVGKMTTYQIRTYMAPESDLGPGTFRVSAEESAAASARIQESHRLRGLT
jgi:hypothetical protein